MTPGAPTTFGLPISLPAAIGTLLLAPFVGAAIALGMAVLP